MTKEQALNMLRFIADLYKVVNTPDLIQVNEQPQEAPAATNGHKEAADVAQAQPMAAN